METTTATSQTVTQRNSLGVDKLRSRNVAILPTLPQGIGAPRAAAKSEYHSSRVRETLMASAHERSRSGRVVPSTGWILAGCLSSQASEDSLDACLMTLGIFTHQRAGLPNVFRLPIKCSCEDPLRQRAPGLKQDALQSAILHRSLPPVRIAW